MSRCPVAEDADPIVVVPKRRRTLWEHGADLKFANVFLLLSNLILGSVALFAILGWEQEARKPKPVLQEDAGFVMYRTTEAYRLRKDIVSTFCQEILRKLLSIHPGYYDNQTLAHCVSATVLQRYSQIAAEGGTERLTTNQRQIFEPYETRRWYDPKYPNLIAAATRGEISVYRETPDTSGNIIVKPENSIRVVVCLLNQKQPTPENPYGLVVVGIYHFRDEEAKKVWSDTSDFVGTKDLEGHDIQAERSAQNQR